MLKREGELLQDDHGTLRGGHGSDEVTFTCGELSTETRCSSHRVRASEPVRAAFVLVEVGAGAVDLTEQGQRLDRVGPHGVRGVVDPRGQEDLWQITQIVASFIEVAERQLDTPEHARARNDEVAVRHLLCGGETVLSRRACLLDEPEIGFDQRLHPSRHPSAVQFVCLLHALMCLRRALQRDCPSTSQPVADAEAAEHLCTGVLVPTCFRAAVDVLQDRARWLHLTDAHEQAGQCNSRALVIPEAQRASELDLGAPFEDSDAGVSGEHVGLPYSCDCQSD